MGHVLPVGNSDAEVAYKCIWMNYFSLLLGIIDQNTFLILLLLSSNCKIGIWLVTKLYFTAVSPPVASAQYCFTTGPCNRSG